MNIEKAKLLLEKLRVRTEGRGATTAEAIQAAELAEKIASRYGLDVNQTSTGSRTHRMKEKRFPKWANILLWGLDRRFDIVTRYATGGGIPVEVIFDGPEHLVKVATWLFKAIVKDLDKQSYLAARAMGCKGGDLVRFRNEFRTSACWRIYTRLNPPTEAELIEARKQADKAIENALKQDNSKCKRMKPWTQSDSRKAALKLKARKYGVKAGDEISIDTNVLPNHQQETLHLT